MLELLLTVCTAQASKLGSLMRFSKLDPKFTEQEGKLSTGEREGGGGGGRGGGRDWGGGGGGLGGGGEGGGGGGGRGGGDERGGGGD